ncbi:septation protein SepH [Propioniciclava soli]|uniref:Septation protein SepH n=1 Tax=Propioniciclava soli TaxID=2775081 RepID=A0ABZ3CBB5_9ACTN|nr:septation protein SepH [Propioniciclava soli]
MDSALRPRDIQARIRAGESPDEVAAAAGVPVEQIAGFALPVVAEREHVAGLARTHPVRRRGETTSHRTLAVAVSDALAQRGIDADTATWDAWKLEDRRWRVRAVFDADAGTAADFTYDQGGRFAVAANDEARALIGDAVAAPAAVAPLDDELALVRAVQEPAAPSEPSATGTGAVATVTELAPPVAQDAVADIATPSVADTPPPAPDATDDTPTDVVDTTESADGEAEEDPTRDAYFEAELTEVDGVADIVVALDTDMDVLYDMLSSFDEDSVKIYAGLVQPIQESLPVVDDAPVPSADADDRPGNEAETESDDDPEPPVDVAAEDVGAEDVWASTELPAPAASSEEPEQLSLIDDIDPAPVLPKPRPRKKRASVPSWDEIVFGGPTPRQQD